MIVYLGFALDFLYRLCFGFFSTKFFRKFRDLLQVNRAPSDYSWEWHTQESVVYVRTKHVGPGSATQFYIGSTADTIHRRELSRRRKFLQLCRHRIAYFEPALKVWACQGDFYCGIGIVLRHVEDTGDRLAWEAKYIRDFQPPLNTSWVGQLLSKLRLHERRFTLPSPGTGRRFVDRARRHARYKVLASLQPIESNDVFLSLYKLGSNSKQKFHEAKLLRSRLTDLTHLYLRARLMKFISGPWKTRATKQLRLTLAFRQGHPPSVNRPLILPRLSHDLRQEVQILIRRLTCQERCNFPPLHLPTTKLVYCKGQQLATQVINYRTFLRRWTRTQTRVCTCGRLAEAYPQAVTASGHVFSAARTNSSERRLVRCQLVRHDVFLQRHMDSFDKSGIGEFWRKRWRLPSRIKSVLQDWVQEQWPTT